MTLLEVLVALAIFATSAIAILRSVSQHVNTLTYLEEKMFASIVADNQMIMIQLEPASLSDRKGEETLAGKTWYYHIKPIATEQALLKAYDVSVSTTRDGNSIVTVTSYVSP